MTQYSQALAKFMSALFPPQDVSETLGELFAERGLKQLRIAETEKYPHVTFFMNGGRETQYPGEDRIMVPSPKVATYDLQPEMSAPEVTDKLVEAIASGTYDLIIVNYANPDMVGHTGIMKAAVNAVETVDECLGRLRQVDVPIIVVNAKSATPIRLRNGRLADVAPTLLDLVGLQKPAQMTGESLIQSDSRTRQTGTSG